MKSTPLRAPCARAGSAAAKDVPATPARKLLRCMAYPPRIARGDATPAPVLRGSLFPIPRPRNRGASGFLLDGDLGDLGGVVVQARGGEMPQRDSADAQHHGSS